MQLELDLCKNCVEYGSEFCEDCLKDLKNVNASDKPQTAQLTQKVSRATDND
jgi:hypothetical protein